MRFNLQRAVGRTIIFLVLATNLFFLVHAKPVQAQEENPTPEETPNATVAAGAEAEASEPTATATAIAPIADEAASSLASITLEEWARIALLAVVVYIAAHFVSIFVIWISRVLVRRTTSPVDDELFKAIQPQISWLLAALGFQIATNRMAITSPAVKDFLSVAYYVLYWAALMAVAWRLIEIVIMQYSRRLNAHPNTDKALSERGMLLLERLSHLLLVFVGLAILLNHFGVELLAITSAIGQTGFAIGLAAKDTITNIISGLVIMFDHPFSIGDRIDVPALGTWGDVVEIGMRTTRVITRDNRMVLIPNASVVDNDVVNYSKPDSTYRLQTDIGIGGEENIADVMDTFVDPWGFRKKLVRRVDKKLRQCT